MWATHTTPGAPARPGPARSRPGPRPDRAGTAPGRPAFSAGTASSVVVGAPRPAGAGYL